MACAGVSNSFEAFFQERQLLAHSARSAYGSFPVLSARWRLIEKDSNGST